MESRYLYRGKRIENGEWNGKWVEGRYYEFMGKSYIFEQPFTSGNLTYEIDPSTICQCTGLKDKNGKLIWENDICDRKEKYPEIVKYTGGDWTLDYSYVYKKEYGHAFCNLGFYATERKSVKVIGNVFDNPELLEVQQYREIGTVEECRAAVEKQTAKKVKSISQVKDGDSYVGLIGRCPCCGDILEEDTVYCDCGQRLDWNTDTVTDQEDTEARR